MNNFRTFKDSESWIGILLSFFFEIRRKERPSDEVCRKDRGSQVTGKTQEALVQRVSATCLKESSHQQSDFIDDIILLLVLMRAGVNRIDANKIFLAEKNSHCKGNLFTFSVFHKAPVTFYYPGGYLPKSWIARNCQDGSWTANMTLGKMYLIFQKDVPDDC